jgi:hypothetical protein
VFGSGMICCPGKNNSDLIANANAPPIIKNVIDEIIYNKPISV